MRKLLTVLIFATLGALAGSAPAFAQKANHPWEADARLLEAVEKGIQKNGIVSVRSRVDDLEKALAGAPHALELAEQGEGDTHYVLTDGQQDTLVQMASAAVTGAKGKTLAVANPYPGIAFYLASYYDEVSKPADAVRVLNAGLATTNAEFGESPPQLLLERGAAFNNLKRSQDALDSYETMLAILDQPADLRAVGLRGRGFALTELGRLDDAEAAYRDSLELAPNNPVALGELKYIAGLKAGREKTLPVMTKVQPGQGAN